MDCIDVIADVFKFQVMKMVMTLTAAESGCIHYVKRAGAALESGCVIAKLQLDDPSRVQQVLHKVTLLGDFAGTVHIPARTDTCCWHTLYKPTGILHMPATKSTKICDISLFSTKYQFAFQVWTQIIAFRSFCYENELTVKMTEVCIFHS